jgi:hypothetical protein
MILKPEKELGGWEAIRLKGYEASKLGCEKAKRKITDLSLLAL